MMISSAKIRKTSNCRTTLAARITKFYRINNLHWYMRLIIKEIGLLKKGGADNGSLDHNPVRCWTVDI